MADLVPKSSEDLFAEAIADNGVATPSSPRPNQPSWTCNTCACKATQFFCAQCVTHGNFTCSQRPHGERFANRRLELLQVNQRRLRMANDFMNISEDLQKTEDVVRNINRKKWIIKCLTQSLETVRTANEATRTRLVTTQKEIDEDNYRFEQLQQICTKTKKKLLEDKSELKGKQRAAHLIEIDIVKRRQVAVKQVTRDIFPLIELDKAMLPVRASSAQASPVVTEYCRILEPILPLDGNYSAYHNYAAQVRELPTDVNVRNPLYEVPAGLGMVAQLLHIIIQILDFQMPDLVEFGLFLGPELDESSFQKAVYQLNWNILTLSSSQGIRVEDLPLKETLGNLLKLLKWKQLGRTGPYDLSNVLVFTMEDSSTNPSLQEAANDEEQHPVETLEAEGVDETDWENIPAASSSVTPSAHPHDPLTRSTFGSAVSAVSSLFRSTTNSPSEFSDVKTRPR